MRIAFVSLMSGSQWGGSELLWNAIANYALERGDNIFVSVYDWGKPHEKIKLLQEQKAHVHFRKRYNPSPRFIEKILRFIKKNKPSLNSDYNSIIQFNPDIILISQGDTFDLAIHHKPLYYLIKQNKIPYSLICHNHIQYSLIPPQEIYPNAKEVFSNASNIFFVSKRQWQLTERRLATKLKNGVFTWNPLNISLPVNVLPWPNDDVIQMAIVASLNGNKGQDTAMEVLSAPQWQRRNWVLNLYGEGEGKKYLEDLANFYGIKNKIKFYGHVNNITEVWTKNHILLIPSAGEGLPISLIEAMACQRPSVITDVGGNTEVIKEDITGFIAASPSKDSFSIALEKAWANYKQWHEMGLNSFQYIKDVYDENSHINIYNCLKHQILSKELTHESRTEKDFLNKKC